MVYQLPAATEHSVLDVAGRSHLLLFGELHGTCEVPNMISALLPKLEVLGYRGLALEVPFDARDQLAGWASGSIAQPPAFYSHPSKDGRGNQQALDLATSAAARGFELLCFDQGHGQNTNTWPAVTSGWPPTCSSSGVACASASASSRFVAACTLA